MAAPSQEEEVRLIIGPRPQMLNDEEIEWMITGLSPSTKVTVSCFVQCEEFQFLSWAHFISRSTDGIISNRRNSSFGGSFFGLKPMGLITHLSPCSGQRGGARYVVKDVTVPLVFKFAVHSGFLPSESEVKNDRMQPLANACINRTYMAEGVRRIEVSTGRVRGVLFLPAGAPPYPRPVIDMFGAVGGCLQFRAALLASRGFPTLALAWTKYRDLENTTLAYDIEYFGEALDWLLGHEEIDDKNWGAGVVSVSGGANIAAQMAVYFPRKVTAVVGINGFYVNLGGRLNGVDIPCDVTLDIVNNMRRFKIQSLTGRSARCPELYDIYARDSIVGLIPVEVSDPRCRFLYIVGEDDLIYPTELAASRSAQRLADAGRSDHVRVLRYPGAGHLIEPPYGPCNPSPYSPPFDDVILCGGTADCHSQAEVAAWRETLNFFEKALTPRHLSAVSSSKL